MQTVPAAASSAAALRLPRQPRRPRARSSPGSRAAGSGRRDSVSRYAAGPAGTVAGGHSWLLLPNKEVRATESERSGRSSPSGREDARRADHGGLRELSAVGESQHLERRSQGLPPAAPLPLRVGAPAAAALQDLGVQRRTRLKAPTCLGQPLPRGGCRPPGLVGRGLGGFSRNCPEEALVMRARGERPGMEDGCSDRGGVLMGSRCGCGPDPGSPRPGRTEWAQPPASGEENEGRRPRTPGEEGCGERALWSRGPGKSSGVPHLWGMAGGPRSRHQALPSCLAGEAAGSAEPTAHTRAHTPQEHAQCGPGNFLPSREPPGPLPARGSQSWGWRGARVGGAAPACRPLVSRSSFPALPLLDPRSFSRRQPPRLGTKAWMSFPAPQGQVRGWPEAWRCGCLRGVPARRALARRTDPAR